MGVQKIILVMGPVGSGKSTQAKLVAENLGASVLNVGDLLHYKSQEKTENASAILVQMDKGGLVDEKLVLKLVEEHLNQKEHRGLVVLDGFPRSLWQAKNFSLPVAVCVYLKVSDNINTSRLLKRGRRDDLPGVIKKRLRIYHQETEPILDHYRAKGVLLEVDGEGEVEDILENILKKINI